MSFLLNKAIPTKAAPIATALAVLILAACSSVEQSGKGPKLPSDELAQLSPGGRAHGPDCSGWNGSHIKINGTDHLYGERIHEGTVLDWWLGDYSSTTTSLLVLPGENIVRWGIQNCPSTNSDHRGPPPSSPERGHYHGSFRFTAEAGHSYRIESEIVDNAQWVRLIDKSTKQIVVEYKHTGSLEIARAYDGPVRNRSELVVLSGSYAKEHLSDYKPEQYFNWPVFITSLDKKWKIPQHWPDQVEIELLHGSHEVEIKPFGRGLDTVVSMKFVAEGGHKYQIRSKGQRKTHWYGWAENRIWIEDVTSKTVVSELFCKTLKNRSNTSIEKVNCSAKP